MLSLVLQFISLESSTMQERYSTLSTEFFIYYYLLNVLLSLYDLQYM